MKILVVSATENEIRSLKKKLKLNKSTVCVMKYSVIKEYHVDFLITGVGGVLTSHALTKALMTRKYDLVINAGIAGSFTADLEIGDVVFVEADEFADLGIEDKNEFYTLFEKGFIQNDEKPFQNAKLLNPHQFSFDLPKVTGITVNTTHGNTESIRMFKNKFNADVETMEGAAFMYVCLQEGIKFMQIRAISNYVEERDTANWNIPLAIDRLNQKLFDMIDVLVKKN